MDWVTRFFSQSKRSTFLLLIIAGLAGCSSPASLPTDIGSLTPEPTNVTGTMNACAVLTQADVQPVLDSSIRTVQPNVKAYNIPVTPFGSCTYSAGLEAVVVAIAKPDAAKGSADWKVAETTWFASAQYNSTVTTVNGLGSAALWSESPKGTGGGYAVSNYPYLIDVMIAGKLSNSPETYGVKLLNLTKKVMSRLH